MKFWEPTGASKLVNCAATYTQERETQIFAGILGVKVPGDKRNRAGQSSNAGEVVAALRLIGKPAEEAQQVGALRGIGSKCEGFAAGEFEEFVNRASPAELTGI